MRALGRYGFTLIELLVVIAIISILVSMYLSVLVKVRQKALQVVHTEGMRQDTIGRMADNANIARPQPTAAGLPDRDDCRRAFRDSVETGAGDIFVSRMLYIVRNEDEFKAYWHTLINPANTSPLDLSGTTLTVEDEDGNEYELSPMPMDMDVNLREVVPVAWEFISTRMADNTTQGIGGNVLYNDGHVQYLRYPSRYPMSPTVAELSRRFMDG